MSKQALHPRTESINQKQKNHSKLARLAALNWLKTRFPLAFDNQVRISPLKIGIMEDVLAYAEEAALLNISKSKLREAVVIFTRRIDYLTCLKAREMRIDLQGEPVVMVSIEEAEQAALKIKKRIEKTLKNARQIKTPEVSRATTRVTEKVAEANQSYYPERPPAFSANNSAQPIKTVNIKHKASRAYDPEAVLRLKEKLGIARRADSKE